MKVGSLDISNSQVEGDGGDNMQMLRMLPCDEYVSTICCIQQRRQPAVSCIHQQWSLL